jgi:hypothetical protein
VRSFERKRPVRQPFPDDIERERVVIPAPTQCPWGATEFSSQAKIVLEDSP